MKMCTAAMYKGTLALFVQALLPARAHGVVEHVLDDRRRLPAPRRRAGRHARPRRLGGERYAGEMREIAATQAAAGGLPESLFAGVAAAYDALSRRPLARREPEAVDRALPLDEALAELA